MKKRENEPKTKDPIGAPPAFLNTLEKTAYRQIVKLCITGVLTKADSLAVAQAAILQVICTGRAKTKPVGRKGTKNYIPAKAIIPKVAERNLLNKYLSQFGMTPSERSKISVLGDRPKNPFDE